MRTCGTCQRELATDQFYPSTPSECRDCRSAYLRAWRATNAEKTRRYAREAYRRKRAELIATMDRICEHCQGPIPHKRGIDACFCSRACVLAAQEARHRAAALKLRVGRTCDRCGVPIPISRSPKATTCSIKCRDALNERRLMHRKCRMLSHYAVKMGRLVKQPCEVCGSLDVEMHHEDYFEPLNVRWFCFLHHRTVMHGQQVVDRS